MPAYVLAYATTDFLHYSGPLQTALREATGWQRPFWPDVRSLPAAVALIAAGPNGFGVMGERPALLWLVPGLGMISALGVSANFLSSRLLPFVLFGLLMYVEPVLLVVVALFLTLRRAPPASHVRRAPRHELWTAAAIAPNRIREHRSHRRPADPDWARGGPPLAGRPEWMPTSRW